MDSVCHTRVATFMLPYIEEQTGIALDQSAFFYGNLKPDLTGTYLTVRHYPSLMLEEVIARMYKFCERYTIDDACTSNDFVVDLGEICHYITDFFTYPHNDDIYTKNLLQHYMYEKRMTLGIARSLTQESYDAWVGTLAPIYRLDRLEARLRSMHDSYKVLAGKIETDLAFICKMTTMVALSILGVLQMEKLQPAYEELQAQQLA